MKTRTPAHAGSGELTSKSAAASASLLRPAGVHKLETSIKKQWKKFRRDLDRCRKRFSESTIHDSRVESRRILASIELLSGFLKSALVKKMERCLKSYRDAFDDLRDTQVQLIILRSWRRRTAPVEDFQKCLCKREQRLVRKTRKAIKKFRTGKLASLVGKIRGDLGKKLSRTPPKEAEAILISTVDQVFEEVRKLHAKVSAGDTRTIHRTRVRFKKFRYMMETLAEHAPAIDASLVGAMQRYQTLMGRIQDAEVMLSAFSEFVRNEWAEDAQALNARKWLVRQRDALVRKYLRSSDRLFTFWPPRRSSRRRTPRTVALNGIL
jgi:CHAD domain-containing protein